MAEKKAKKHYLRNIVNFLMVIPSVFGLFTGLLSLIESEASSAKRSIGNLIILFSLFSILLLTTWFSLLGLLLLYLLSIPLSYLASFGIIFGLNLLLLIIVLWMIVVTKRQLFFPTTRAMIRNFLHR